MIQPRFELVLIDRMVLLLCPAAPGPDVEDNVQFARAVRDRIDVINT